ncbi:PREDICTED: transcription factor GTE7-like [Ipomoea nil]|uniref:transcription factor GTE7-like n=1 Tax=Ipomoea nil TaxID=35883 RepID=UPI0009014179|nr:PREDICTED: transcription factor GTE7-like [Ipomoea nil]
MADKLMASRSSSDTGDLLRTREIAATEMNTKHFHQTAKDQPNDDSPVVTQAASDDAYSFNQRPIKSNGLNFGGYLTYNVTSYTKSELNELQKRPVSELEQIRNLKDRIESGHFSTTVNNPRSHGKSKKLSANKWPMSFGSNKDPEKFCNGVDNVKSVGVVGRGGINGIGLENMMKDCRQILLKLMKHKNGWIFNTPIDAVALGLHGQIMLKRRCLN